MRAKGTRVCTTLQREYKTNNRPEVRSKEDHQIINCLESPTYEWM
jgi:hypothetical protein